MSVSDTAAEKQKKQLLLGKRKTNPEWKKEDPKIEKVLHTPVKKLRTYEKEMPEKPAGASFTDMATREVPRIKPSDTREDMILEDGEYELDEEEN